MRHGGYVMRHAMCITLDAGHQTQWMRHAFSYTISQGLVNLALPTSVNPQPAGRPGVSQPPDVFWDTGQSDIPFPRRDKVAETGFARPDDLPFICVSGTTAAPAGPGAIGLRAPFVFSHGLNGDLGLTALQQHQSLIRSV